MRYDDLIVLVREFPDRSIKWLLETPDNLRGLLLATIGELAERINYAKLQKLDRTFIQDSFRKREADLVFTAPFADESGGQLDDIIIFILIEHQSTVDPTIPFRMLFYMMQLWDMQRREWEDKNIPLHQWRFRPILPVVFYTGSQKWNAPMEMKYLMKFPKALERLVPQQEMFLLDLKSTEPERLIKYDNSFGWVLRIIQKEESPTEEFAEMLRLTVEHLEQIPYDKRSNWEKLLYFLVVLIYQRRGKEEHNKLLEIVENTVISESKKEEVEKMGKTMAQVLIEEGIEKGMTMAQVLIEEGIEKGREEGKREGLCDAISLGLELRFGVDSLSLMEKVQKVDSLERLELIKEAIRTNKSLEEIEKLVL